MQARDDYSQEKRMNWRNAYNVEPTGLGDVLASRVLRRSCPMTPQVSGLSIWNEEMLFPDVENEF